MRWYVFVALAIAGLCLASGRIDASLAVLALGGAVVAWLAQERRLWTAAGFFYAAAAEAASVLVRLDQVWGFVALILILLVMTGATRYIMGPALSAMNGFYIWVVRGLI